MKYTTHLLLVLLTLPAARLMAHDTALHKAIKSGNVEKMKELIKNGAKVDSDATLLKEAAKLGNVGIVKLLLDNGANVNGIVNNYSNYYTPLHEAARVGDLEMCKTLLSYGAKVDHQVDNGNWGMTDTPLAVAARNDHFEVVKLLLENGANVMADNVWGLTILESLSHRAKAKVIELLLSEYEQGENIAKVEDVFLLQVAATTSNVAIAKRLLDNGANVNGANRNGIIPRYTPLHEAAASGNLEMVKLLLSYGAKVDHQVNDRYVGKEKTALALAAALAAPAESDLFAMAAHYYEVCELLIEKGAKVNVRLGRAGHERALIDDVLNTKIRALLKKHGATS